MVLPMNDTMNPKLCVIAIPADLHQRLKVAAAERGIPIRRFVEPILQREIDRLAAKAANRHPKKAA